ncbi:MAG: hypothetical protein RR705_05735 [Lachnospiraceae bacterium]
MEKITYEEYYHALDVIELFVKQIEEDRKVLRKIPNGDLLCSRVCIPQRTKKILEANDIETINDLIQYLPSDIMKLRGISGRAVQGLVDFLEEEFNYDWMNRTLLKREIIYSIRDGSQVDVETFNAEDKVGAAMLNKTK